MVDVTKTERKVKIVEEDGFNLRLSVEEAKIVKKALARFGRNNKTHQIFIALDAAGVPDMPYYKITSRHHYDGQPVMDIVRKEEY